MSKTISISGGMLLGYAATTQYTGSASNTYTLPLSAITNDISKITSITIEVSAAGDSYSTPSGSVVFSFLDASKNSINQQTYSFSQSGYTDYTLTVPAGAAYVKAVSSLWRNGSSSYMDHTVAVGTYFLNFTTSDDNYNYAAKVSIGNNVYNTSAAYNLPTTSGAFSVDRILMPAYGLTITAATFKFMYYSKNPTRTYRYFDVNGSLIGSETNNTAVSSDTTFSTDTLTVPANTAYIMANISGTRTYTNSPSFDSNTVTVSGTTKSWKTSYIVPATFTSGRLSIGVFPFYTSTAPCNTTATDVFVIINGTTKYIPSTSLPIYLDGIKANDKLFISIGAVDGTPLTEPAANLCMVGINQTTIAASVAVDTIREAGKACGTILDSKRFVTSGQTTLLDTERGNFGERITLTLDTNRTKVNKTVYDTNVKVRGKKTVVTDIETYADYTNKQNTRTMSIYISDYERQTSISYGYVVAPNGSCYVQVFDKNNNEITSFSYTTPTNMTFVDLPILGNYDSIKFTAYNPTQGYTSGFTVNSISYDYALDSTLKVDTERQISGLNIQTINLNTKRELTKNITITEDTQKKVMNNVEEAFDLKRAISEPFAKALDLIRKVAVKPQLKIDTFVKVLKDKVLKADSKRSLRNIETSSSDTSRITAANKVQSFDTIRALGIPTVISIDSKRITHKDIEVGSDTNRKEMNVETSSSDTSRTTMALRTMTIDIIRAKGIPNITDYDTYAIKFNSGSANVNPERIVYKNVTLKADTKRKMLIAQDTSIFDLMRRVGGKCSSFSDTKRGIMAQRTSKSDISRITAKDITLTKDTSRLTSAPYTLDIDTERAFSMPQVDIFDTKRTFSMGKQTVKLDTTRKARGTYYLDYASVPTYTRTVYSFAQPTLDWEYIHKLNFDYTRNSSTSSSVTFTAKDGTVLKTITLSSSGHYSYEIPKDTYTFAISNGNATAYNIKIQYDYGTSASITADTSRITMKLLTSNVEIDTKRKTSVDRNLLEDMARRLIVSASMDADIKRIATQKAKTTNDTERVLYKNASTHIDTARKLQAPYNFLLDTKRKTKEAASINFDSFRFITKKGNATNDSKRTTTKTTSIVEDTRRKLTLQETLSEDVTRRITTKANSRMDTLRAAHKAVTLNEDTTREITMSNSITRNMDTKRMVVQNTIVGLDLKRRVSVSAHVSLDTKRTLINAKTLKIDSKRIVFKGKTLNLDTAVIVRSTQTTDLDTKRITTTNFTIDVHMDTKRVISVGTLGTLDTKRSTLKNTKTSTDTTRRIIKAKSISLDTARALTLTGNANVDTRRLSRHTEEAHMDTKVTVVNLTTVCNDTTRHTGIAQTTAFDTDRVMGIPGGAKVDTLRTVFDTSNHVVDTKRTIEKDMTVKQDTKRKVVTTDSEGINTSRKVKSKITASVDTDRKIVQPFGDYDGNRVIFKVAIDEDNMLNVIEVKFV